MLYTSQTKPNNDGSYIIKSSKTRKNSAYSEVEVRDILAKEGIIGLKLECGGNIAYYPIGSELSKLIYIEKGEIVSITMPEYGYTITVMFKEFKQGYFYFMQGHGELKLSPFDIIRGRYVFSFTCVDCKVESFLRVYHI